jgi:hypothetical protein
MAQTETEKKKKNNQIYFRIVFTAIVTAGRKIYLPGGYISNPT